MAFRATTSPIHVLALVLLIFASTKIHHAQGKSITGPCVIVCSKQTIACVVRCRFATDKCSQDCAVDSIHCVSTCITQNTPPSPPSPSPSPPSPPSPSPPPPSLSPPPPPPPPPAMILDTNDSRDRARMEHTSNFDLNPMY
ncbi:hypothetical protein A4A49_55866 [Nicotiana attenuata]|uniref:Uncharacterized protein n=1 Tax=Nicotiana attenuata TaxID=49451 RepID=A0A314LG25_NICAT|nr:hypothetical protein A4A49_55866 [Nicotiana attenuata]